MQAHGKILKPKPAISLVEHHQFAKIAAGADKEDGNALKGWNEVTGEQ